MVAKPPDGAPHGSLHSGGEDAVPGQAATSTSLQTTQPALSLRPKQGLWGLVKRTGRGGLKAARPLALPLLNRFQLRVASAVHSTGVVEAIAALTRAQQAQSEAVNALVHVQTHAATALDATTRQIVDRLNHIEARMAAVEAVARLHAAALEAVNRTTLRLGPAIERLDRRVVGHDDRLTGLVDVLRSTLVPLSDQSAALSDLTAASARVEAAAGGLPRLEQTVLGLHQKADAAATLVAATATQATQLVNRSVIPLTDGDVAVRTPNGYVVVPGSDPMLIVHLAEGGGHETGTVGLLQAITEDGDTVVDIGAHVGLMAVPLARRVGRTGRVIAFEPSPHTLACLRRTLALNGVQDRVTVQGKAVGDETREAALHMTGSTSLNSLIAVDDETETVAVAMTRLDDAVAAGTRVAVVKVDVEGAELQVLAGMGRVLSENPDLLMVVEFANEHLVRTRTPVAEWVGRFQAAGLTAMLRIGEQDGRCEPISVDGLQGCGDSMNLVLARPGAPRLARLGQPRPGSQR